MTEEQIKAHHDFFARRYNIDIWKSSHKQSTPRWRDKRIIRDYNIYTLFRTHVWDSMNIIHLWKIQVALKSWLIWKSSIP